MKNQASAPKFKITKTIVTRFNQPQASRLLGLSTIVTDTSTTSLPAALLG